MKYYMIILNDTFIGVIHSGQFVREMSNGHLRFSDEVRGQFIDYEGVLYRDYWMTPITATNRQYQMATVREITEAEYNDIQAMEENNEPVEIEEEVIEEPVAIIDQGEIDAEVKYLRNLKLKDMSRICNKTIEEGFDLELRGETQHFSLNTQDQLNLMNLNVMAQTEEFIPYHADGKTCTFYTAAEINQIVDAANKFKIYHTTYYNALKNYINALDSVEAIGTIQYGIEIPEQYQSDVLKTLEVIV